MYNSTPPPFSDFGSIRVIQNFIFRKFLGNFFLYNSNKQKNVSPLKDLLELYKISFQKKNSWKFFLYNSNRLERCVFVSYLIKETYFFLGQNFFFYSFSFEICLRQNNSIRVIQKNLVKKNHNALNFV